MANLKKAIGKTECLKKAIKKDYATPNPMAQKCIICKGEGYIVIDEKRIKCQHCVGAGWTFVKPERRIVGTNTNGTTLSKVRKEAVQVKSLKDNTQKVFKHNTVFKATSFNDVEYLVNSEIIIKRSLVPEIDKVEKLKTDIMSMVFKPYQEALGLDTLESIIKAKGLVQGVRYKVEQELHPLDITGKEKQELEYVQSGYKLSKKVWINSKYVQIFKNCKFLYLNPIHKHNFVLCINKDTLELEGAVMPLSRKDV